MNKLFYKIQGKGLPIILIHGFTGSHKSFDVMSKYLQQFFKVIMIDLPGHGNSMTRNESIYSFENSSKLILDIIDELKLIKVNVLGYSLGGRNAMHLATKFQKKINKLILCSASYGLDNQEEQKKRNNSDQKLIDLLTNNNLEKFVKYWESLPLWSSENKLPINKKQKLKEIRLSHNPYGLALNLKHQGQGKQRNLLANLEKINTKTLIMYGENDYKYKNISKTISNSIRKSKTIMVPDSGHNIILENPIFVSREVKDFILGENNVN
jgi:2-succinyl-6-hydroxy-2,4-cyclohexadiene-1-carboxylate synthase